MYKARLVPFLSHFTYIVLFFLGQKKFSYKLQNSQTKWVVNFTIKDKSIGGLMMDYKMSCLLQSRLARASVALLVSLQLEESWRIVLHSTTICFTSQLEVWLLETGFATFLASISPTSYDQSINILHLHWTQYRSKKTLDPSNLYIPNEASSSSHKFQKDDPFATCGLNHF